jgi:ABC-type amino acid transport substrate-binding protein
MRITGKLLIITSLLTSTVAFSQKYKGDSWAKVKTTGSGTLAVVYYEQPGLVAKGTDGKIKGVCVDILSDFQKYVESKYSKKIEVKFVGEETEFPSFLNMIQTTPNILGVTNTTITDERKKIMKFTPPYMNNQIVLLTHKNAPSIKSLSELPTVMKGFTAQVISGSTHVEAMEKIKKEHYPNLKIESVASGDIIIKNLSENPKLFSIIDFTEYIGVIRRKLPVKRQEVEIGALEALGFVMSKQSDWDELWKEFLTPQYRQSVRYKEIIAQNLGHSFLSLVR